MPARPRIPLGLVVAGLGLVALLVWGSGAALQRPGAAPPLPMASPLSAPAQGERLGDLAVPGTAAQPLPSSDSVEPAALDTRTAVTFGPEVAVIDALTEEPLPGAEVYWLPLDQPGHSLALRHWTDERLASLLPREGHRLRVDGAGRVRLPAGTGPVVLCADAKGQRGRRAVQRTDGTQSMVELTVYRPLPIGVRLTGPGGRPLEGISCAFDESPDVDRARTESLWRETDEAGRAEFEVRLTTFERAGRVPWRDRRLHLEIPLDGQHWPTGQPPLGPEEGILSLPLLHRDSGAERREPGTGAEIAVELPPHGSILVEGLRDLPIFAREEQQAKLHADGVKRGSLGPLLCTAETDARGGVRFPVVPLGRRYVVVHGSDRLSVAGPLSDGEEVRVEGVELDPDLHVRARLLGEDGQPLGDESISLSVFTARDLFHSAELETGADGTIEWRASLPGRELPDFPALLIQSQRIWQGTVVPLKPDQGRVVDLGVVALRDPPILAAGELLGKRANVIRVETAGIGPEFHVVACYPEYDPEESQFEFRGWPLRDPNSAPRIVVWLNHGQELEFPFTPGATDLELRLPEMAELAISWPIQGLPTKPPDRTRTGRRSPISSLSRQSYFPRAEVRVFLGEAQVAHARQFVPGWIPDPISLPVDGEGLARVEVHLEPFEQPLTVITDIDLRRGQVTHDPRLLPIEIDSQVDIRGGWITVTAVDPGSARVDAGIDALGYGAGLQAEWVQRGPDLFLPFDAHLDVLAHANGHFDQRLEGVREDRLVTLRPGGELRVEVTDTRPGLLYELDLEPSSSLRARYGPHRAPRARREGQSPGFRGRVSAAGDWEVVFRGRQVDQTEPRELGRHTITVLEVPEEQLFRVELPR
jgi:hypothetical protein